MEGRGRPQNLYVKILDNGINLNKQALRGSLSKISGCVIECRQHGLSPVDLRSPHVLLLGLHLLVLDPVLVGNLFPAINAQHQASVDSKWMGKGCKLD